MQGRKNEPTIADSVAVAEQTGLADAIRRNGIATESDLLVATFGLRQAECEQYKKLVAELTAERDEWKGRAAFAEQTILAQQQRIVELEAAVRPIKGAMA